MDNYIVDVESVRPRHVGPGAQEKEERRPSHGRDPGDQKFYHQTNMSGIKISATARPSHPPHPTDRFNPGYNRSRA